MYLHVGDQLIINSDRIVGVFDLRSGMNSKYNEEFLKKNESLGKVRKYGIESPKTFVVTTDGNVHLLRVSTLTLKKRSSS